LIHLQNEMHYYSGVDGPERFGTPFLYL